MVKGARTTADVGRPATASTDYVRFILLSGPRTGSYMLAQALNSSPHITCFGEVFNPMGDFIQFFVDGYDNFSARDMSLRSQDPIRFLEERIFGRHPDRVGVGAVGFKLHYGQFRRFRGLRQRLVEDNGIRVIHLRRQNLLRTLVSLKLARTTGVFMEDSRPRLRLANLMKAARHPGKAAVRLRRLGSRRAMRKGSRPKVTVPPEELFDFIVRTRIRSANYDELFGVHPKTQVTYEGLVDDREVVLREVQSFLGVEAAPLTVTLRKQNPEPLRELIENYDELFDAFKHAPERAYFD